MGEQQHTLAGLRGLSTGTTAICSVGQHAGGLSYYGYDIAQLAELSTFEEVAYLLHFGQLPSEAQLHAYVASLKLYRSLPKTLQQVLEEIPADAHPMDVMRTACSMLGALEPEHSFEQQLTIAERLLSVLPACMCYWYNFSHKGVRVDTVTDDDSVAGHILHLLHGQKPTALQQRAMDVSLVLYAEHEFNASTFSARVCASTLSDFYSAICAAIGTLRGPLHGGANEAALQLLSRYHSTEAAVLGVMQKLQRKEKIMGFGHAVYKQADPRNRVIKQWAKRLSEQTADSRYFSVAEAIEKLMREQKQLFANLDFYSAVSYYLLRIPAKLFTPIFVCSRITGWSAHIMEQRKKNMLIRPSADYIGPAQRDYMPIGQRSKSCA